MLVSKAAGDVWQGKRLNQLHNGSNDQELQRIRNKHAGEGQCILDRRVLGFLAPTRGEFTARLSLRFLTRISLRSRG